MKQWCFFFQMRQFTESWMCFEKSTIKKEETQTKSQSRQQQYKEKSGYSTVIGFLQSLLFVRFQLFTSSGFTEKSVIELSQRCQTLVLKGHWTFSTFRNSLSGFTGTVESRRTPSQLGCALHSCQTFSI